MPHRFSGAELRRRRVAAGKSRTVLAYEIGRSEQTVSLYERGSVDPPAVVLGRLATAVGCLPGDFFASEVLT